MEKEYIYGGDLTPDKNWRPPAVVSLDILAIPTDYGDKLLRVPGYVDDHQALADVLQKLHGKLQNMLTETVNWESLTTSKNELVSNVASFALRIFNIGILIDKKDVFKSVLAFMERANPTIRRGTFEEVRNALVELRDQVLQEPSEGKRGTQNALNQLTYCISLVENVSQRMK